MRDDEALHHFFLTLLMVGGYLLLLFIVLVLSFSRSGWRKTGMRGILPQLAMVFLLPTGVYLLALSSVAFWFLFNSVWILFPCLILIILINKWRQRSLVWTCICHTICLLLLFWQAEPMLTTAWFNHQQLRQLVEAEQENFRTLDRIRDTRRLE